MANPFEAGSIFARFGIDNAPLLKALKQAEAAVTKAVTSIQKKLNTVKIPGLGGLFGKQGAAQQAARVTGFATTKQDLRAQAQGAAAGAGALRIKFDLTGFSSQLDLAQARFADFSAFVRTQSALMGGALNPVIANVKKLTQALTAGIATAQKAASRVGQARAPSGGAFDVSKLQPFGGQQSDIIKQLSAFSKQSALERTFSFKAAQTFNAAISKSAGLLRGGATAASLFFKPLTAGLTAVTKGFSLFNNVLTKSIFSIKNLVVVIASISLIRRAIDVDNITGAFKRLSATVGELGSTFLGRLRKATAGTVSDLDLMRSANQAVLLGVVKSQKEFATLAEDARLLGKALGRSPTEALQDLTLGIGRQSRLILDNLGIIVKAQKAYDDFAASVGKATGELSDQEKRLAFNKAAIEAIRKRAEELRTLATPTADAFGRLTASFQNIFSDVAKALTGPRLPAALAQFLDESRGSITAFAAFVSESFGDVVDELIRQFKRISDAEDPFSALVERLFQVSTSINVGVAKLVASFVASVISELPTFIRLGTFIGATIIKGIGKSLFSDAGQTLSKFLGDLGSRSIIGRPIFGGKEEIDKQADEASLDLTDSLTRIGRKLSTTASAIGDEIVDSLFPDASAFFSKIKSNVEDLQFQIRTGFVTKPIEVVAPIRLLGDAFNAAQVAAVKLARGVSDLQEKIKGVTGLDVPIESGVVKLFKIGIQRGEKFVEGLNVASVLIKNIFSPPDNAQIVNDLLEERTKDLEQFRDKAAEAGTSTEAEAIVAKNLARLKDVASQLSASELAREVRAIEDLKKALESLEATSGVAIFLKDLREEAAKLSIETRKLDFDKGAKSIAKAEAALDNFRKTLSKADFNKVKIEAAQLFQVIEEGADKIEFRKLLSKAEEAVAEIQAKTRSGAKATVSEILREIAEVQEGLDSISADAKERIPGVLGGGFDIPVGKIRKDALSAQIRELQAEFKDLPLTSILGDTAEIEKEIDRIQSVLNQNDLHLNFSEKEIDALEDRLGKLKNIKARIEIASLVHDVTTAFADGLLRAIEKGESFFKQLAEVGADLFRKQFAKVVEDITKGIATAIDGLISKLPGLGGIAGVGGALVGIGGLILSKLASQSEVSVDSFEDQVSSAESVRGVVAGPTNVAIAKVSESLKVALQQSEIFLQRIAIATERMAGTPGAGTPPTNTGLQSSFVRLSTSTPT